MCTFEVTAKETLSLENMNPIYGNYSMLAALTRYS